MKSLNIKPKNLIEELVRLEKCGRYDEAIRELDIIWEDKSSLPEVEDLDKRTAAEVILRCGSLIGFLGQSKQIPNSQEKSKNLLTKARDRFLDIYDVEKIAECENYLALAYWRTGELIEAEIWIESSLSHNLANSDYTRLYSYVIQSILLIAKKDYKKIISNLKFLEAEFRKHGDYYLNGAISSNLGIAYRNLHDSSEAVKYFELAKYFYKKSQHRVYLATTENNIAQFYKSAGNYGEAHKSIDRAANIFKKINDMTRYGFSLDTKASIYLDEGKFNEALTIVGEAIEILEKSENADCLVETYSTKVKILVHLNKIAEAASYLFDAYEVARVKIGEDKAKQLLKEFEQVINITKSPNYIKIYSEKELVEENIKLVLPPSISHYEEIEGVWIKNDYLEEAGLKKGSLAIIVNEKVERGDLVAILERDSEDVSCGFYDIDFGIVCLQVLNEEPQLFSEDEIKILGKIIGTANSQKDNEGKMIVELIKETRT